MGIHRGSQSVSTRFPSLSVDSSDSGVMYENDDNQLGIGVADPDTKLEVFHNGDQLKLSFDADSFAKIGVAASSHTTISTAETGNLILDVAGDIELNADGGDITFKDGSATIGKFSSTAPLGLTIGAGVAEDTMLIFDGNAQDFRIGLDDGTDTLEIGHGTSHGTNTALSINSSGQITTFNIPAAAVAQASDHIIFLDGGAAGAPKAESIDDFLTAIAGSGISVSSSQLTAAGVSALNDLSDVSFSSGDLTITSLDLLTTSDTAHNVAGTGLVIRGGNTTAGTTNDIAGGTLTLQGGQGKGGGAGGNIVFQVANAGGAGSSLNSLATALTISDDKSAEFESTIQSRTSVTVLNTTASSATQGGALILQADDGAAMAQDHRLGVIQFEGAEDASNSLTVGARIEALCDAGWSATENGTRIVFSTTDGNANVSEVLKLDSDKLATFAGAVTVTGDTTVANNLFCGKFISHTGDTDTRIVFADAGDLVLFEAGGVEFFRISEGSSDEFIVNDAGSANVDFRIETNTLTHAIFVDASEDKIGFGDSAPGTQLQMKGTAPYFTIQNSTAENTDGGCEGRVIFEDHANVTLAQIEGSHSGSSDDTKGQFKISTHNGTSLQTAVTILDDQHALFSGNVSLVSDGAFLKFGADEDIVITHEADRGLIITQSTDTTGEPVLTLKNTGDLSQGPNLDFVFDNNAGEADDEVGGQIRFKSDDSGNNLTTFSKIASTVTDVTDGDEGAKISLSCLAGGTAGTAAMAELLAVGGEDVANSTNCAVHINPAGIDCDFIVAGDNDTHLIFAEASTDRVSIGTSTDAPAAVLEVTGDGTSNVPLMQLNNNDADKNVLDINSSNTTADIINVHADGLLGANVFHVTADGLTTGTVIRAVSDSSDTSDRALMELINDHTSATGCVPINVRNDAEGPILKGAVGFGAAATLSIKTQAVTLATSTTVTTVSNFFPANAIPIAMAVRVTTTIGSNLHITKFGTATGGDAGNIYGDPDLLADDKLDTAGQTAVFGLNFGDQLYSFRESANNLVITCSGSVASGAVRLVLYYYDITAPTS